eukprot:1990634-Pyramimonas_sp.AAC.1
MPRLTVQRQPSRVQRVVSKASSQGDNGLKPDAVEAAPSIDLDDVDTSGLDAPKKKRAPRARAKATKEVRTSTELEALLLFY